MKIDVDARERLVAAIRKAGSQRALASRFGVSQQYIQQLATGRREFSDAMLEKLGLRRAVVSR